MSKKAIIIVLCVVGGVLVLGFVVDKVAESIIRSQIEKQIEGSGAQVELGRVAVNLPRRSVTIHKSHIKLQHDDTAVPEKGIIALDAMIDRISARGVSYKNKQIGARSIAINTQNATLALGGKLGTTLMEMGAMNVSVEGMKSASVEIDSLAVAFGEGERDKNRISLHRLTLSGINVDSLIVKQRTLLVDSIVVDSATITSRKNRKITEILHVKPLLWQSVQRLPIAVDIKKVRYNDLDITYRELGAEATSDGIVSILNGHGTVTNLTNIVAGHGRFFVIDLTATLMHTNELTARAQFPVDSLDNHWEMAGRIGKGNLTAFNSALEPLMNVRITRGNLQGMDYKIEGTRTQSHVWLTMRYNDLSVEMLKASDHTKRRGLLSFALNDILIRDSNPGRNGKLRTGEGTQERDPHKSMYNFIWKSLIPGIKQTAL